MTAEMSLPPSALSQPLKKRDTMNATVAKSTSCAVPKGNCRRRACACMSETREAYCFAVRSATAAVSKTEGVLPSPFGRSCPVLGAAP